MKVSTRIIVGFLSEGHPVGFDAYTKHHPSVKIFTNQKIMEKIKNEVKEIEFVGDYRPIGTKALLTEIEKQKDTIDGILVFSGEYQPIPEDIISSGLPIVAVERPLQACSTVPFDTFFGKRALISSLPAVPDKDPKIYSNRIKDIADKIKIINAISLMKHVRILSITDKPPLGYFEPNPQQIETTREEYDNTYLKNLKEIFRSDIISIDQEKLFKKFNASNMDEAEKVAEKWIQEAVALKGTNEQEVIKSAKLYIAMKKLMTENNCNAITTEGFGWPPLGFEKASEMGIPSQGMPTTQLCTDGIAAASETLIDCLIPQQLGLFLNGSTGLLGDYSIDPLINRAIVAHCEGSIKPFKDERRSPYHIRNLPFVEENTGGVCAQIHYPINETVTVLKFSMYRKKVSIFTGETVSGEELFQYWDDILGRNKVVIKADAQKLIENVAWDVFAHHRTVLFGDHRQTFKDLAKLIGFEVLEEDK